VKQEGLKELKARQKEGLKRFVEENAFPREEEFARRSKDLLKLRSSFERFNKR
jgi:hypothetical protein